MAVFVCLVRAIGPRTHEVMTMADLRAGCQRAGLEDVSTFGNTGNLLCRSTEKPQAVRRLVQDVVDGFGLEKWCDVFVRTRRQMATVIGANPFPEAALERPSQVGVCVFQKTPRWPDWIGSHSGPHRLATVGATLVVDYPQGDATPQIDIEKRIGARMTQRNWRVFATLAERAAALDKS